MLRAREELQLSRFVIVNARMLLSGWHDIVSHLAMLYAVTSSSSSQPLRGEVTHTTWQTDRTIFKGRQRIATASIYGRIDKYVHQEANAESDM